MMQQLAIASLKPDDRFLGFLLVRSAEQRTSSKGGKIPGSHAVRQGQRNQLQEMGRHNSAPQAGQRDQGGGHGAGVQWTLADAHRPDAGRPGRRYGGHEGAHALRA